MAWQLAEAKNKFSEVFQKALTEGPQEITRRGRERVYVVSAEEYEMGENKPSLKDFLLHGPKVDEFHVERDKSPMREVEL